MKKVIIILGVVAALLLVLTIVLGVFLFKNNKELNAQKGLLTKQKKQIEFLKESVKYKDKEIENQKKTISENDKKIKSLNKKLNKKKAEEKKANRVAQVGKYESEDSTGIEDANGEHGMQGLQRSLDVKDSSIDRITIYLIETHGSKEEGMIDDQVTVELKNGKGNFECDFGGGMSGREDLKFKGSIEVINPHKIKITCLNNETIWKSGETHTFTLK